MMSTQHRGGTIYFIQAGDTSGPVKIGYTKNLAAVRKSCAQTYNHMELHVLAEASGTRDQEKALHKRFERANIRGEWFEPSPEILELISAISDHGLTLTNYLS